MPVEMAEQYDKNRVVDIETVQKALADSLSL